MIITLFIYYCILLSNLKTHVSYILFIGKSVDYAPVNIVPRPDKEPELPLPYTSY